MSLSIHHIVFAALMHDIGKLSSVVEQKISKSMNLNVEPIWNI